jgi:hypothetical protein
MTRPELTQPGARDRSPVLLAATRLPERGLDVVWDASLLVLYFGLTATGTVVEAARGRLRSGQPRTRTPRDGFGRSALGAQRDG